MVLITGFRATDRFHAFILNALASAVIIVTALYLKGKLDKYHDFKGRTVTQSITWVSIGVTFLVTFLASLIGYWILYYTFGYGQGMLVTD